jgi:hypothetical protein
MRVATFGPTTAWMGIGIEYDGRQFHLEGHGAIPPQALLDYDRLGQIDWAYAGLREWVQTLATGVDAAQVVTGPARPVAFAHSAGRRSSIPPWAIALIVLAVALALTPIIAAVAVPMVAARHDAGHAPSPAPIPVQAPGSFAVELRSDPGDFIGGGKSYSYSPANAYVAVHVTGNCFSLIVYPIGAQVTDTWDGDFQEPSRLHDLEKGHYGNLRRYGFDDPAYGGFDWIGEGRGSNNVTGWFAIERVSYKDGELSAITLRFELHSEDRKPALRGLIGWAR